MKKIVVIGSVGSVGTQTLNVIDRHSDKFEVLALVSGSNFEKLKAQKEKFHPKYCGLFFRGEESEAESFVFGEECYDLAALQEADIVVIASSGISALPYVIRAIKAGKTIAIANKETLVAGGEIIMPMLKEYGARFIPIDSEHNAIWQCLFAGERKDVSKLILTASGGAFRDRSVDELKFMKAEDALLHPNWSMGKKITIDCATMMNKGLEIIEAKWLFSMPIEKIDVVVHRESIVHSMVEFCDMSVIAELSYPTMEIPIGLALSYPDRFIQNECSLDFAKLQKLSFEAPDEKKYPFLKLARDVSNMGGLYPTVMNSANEVAVERFLSGEIGFLDIYDSVCSVLEKVQIGSEVSIESIVETDKITRAIAKRI